MPFSFHDRALTIVGILNVTPDSFSDGGRFVHVDDAVAHAVHMRDAGAHLIDVGGESTRPGAAAVPVDEELDRVLPVVRALAVEGLAVSIDTRRPAVAEACLAHGACVVNDVGGLRDPDMASVVAQAQVPVVIMHTPAPDLDVTHRNVGYQDVVAEVAAFLRQQTDVAVAAGVSEVVIDPGLGFGKSVEDNLTLIGHLDVIAALGSPVLVGASRKRFVGAIGGAAEAHDRDPASIVVHLRSIAAGARAVRVHDVAGHVQALAAWSALNTHA